MPWFRKWAFFQNNRGWAPISFTFTKFSPCYKQRWFSCECFAKAGKRALFQWPLTLVCPDTYDEYPQDTEGRQAAMSGFYYVLPSLGTVRRSNKWLLKGKQVRDGVVLWHKVTAFTLCKVRALLFWQAHDGLIDCCHLMLRKWCTLFLGIADSNKGSRMTLICIRIFFCRHSNCYFVWGFVQVHVPLVKNKEQLKRRQKNSRRQIVKVLHRTFIHPCMHMISLNKLSDPCCLLSKYWSRRVASPDSSDISWGLVLWS